MQRVIVNQVRNLALPFQNLQCKAFRSVESDMAMQKPCAWVIRLEREDKVTASLQGGNISAGRIGQIEVGRGVGTRTGGEEIEVMTVKVDWVSDCCTRLDDNVRPFVGCA